MAGLAAAARLRELGAAPTLLEKGTRPGGSMLLSSCVVWRYRGWDEFRAECPTGDPSLQRSVWEQLDDAIGWLESLGAPLVWSETGNPRTVGKRFDPQRLTETLLGAARVEPESRSIPDVDEGAVILCSGGFQGDAALVDEHIRPAAPLRLRANPWSAGDGDRKSVV